MYNIATFSVDRECSRVLIVTADVLHNALHGAPIINVIPSSITSFFLIHLLCSRCLIFVTLLFLGRLRTCSTPNATLHERILPQFVKTLEVKKNAYFERIGVTSVKKENLRD